MRNGAFLIFLQKKHFIIGHGKHDCCLSVTDHRFFFLPIFRFSVSQYSGFSVILILNMTFDLIDNMRHFLLMRIISLSKNQHNLSFFIFLVIEILYFWVEESRRTNFTVCWTLCAWLHVLFSENCWNIPIVWLLLFTFSINFVFGTAWHHFGKSASHIFCQTNTKFAIENKNVL